MKRSTRSQPRVWAAGVVCLVCAVALSACGGQRGQPQNNAPTAQPATAASQPTPRPPDPTSAPAPTQAPATEVTAPTAAPASTEAPAPASDPLGDEVDQLLRQLNDANAAADTLDDVPELK